jgi:aminopeptidase N
VKAPHCLLALLLLIPSPALALDVSHYLLDIHLDPAAKTIEAMASLDLEVVETDFVAGKFALSFQGLNVEMVAVDGLIVDFEHTGGLLAVALPEGMGPGNHQVEVNYFGTPQPYVTEWGTWGMVFEEDRVFTVNVIEGAQYWFPCNDTLADKASFEIRVSVFGEWIVAAPGELLSVTEGDVMNVHHWLADWEMPTYLMHFSAAPYELVEEEHDGIPYQYFLYPTSWEVAEETLQHAHQAIAMLEELYGDYPFPKVGFDEINLGGAVEQPSCVSIGTQIFAAPEDFAEVVAHEMAHSWFQGVVTIADWKDLWLSEGLATYHEVLYFGYQNGPVAEQTYAQSLALSYRNNAAMGEGFFPLHDPEQMWGVTVYRKGALVFHMLRYLVGDEDFFKILRKYLEQFGGSNATTADFQGTAEGNSGIDLQPFFDEWVYGIGYPQLDVAWRFEQGVIDLVVTQTQPEDWSTFTALPLPLRVVGPPDAELDFQMPLTDRTSEYSLKLPFEPEELLIDPNGWLLMKAQLIDYPADSVDQPVEGIVEPPPETDVVTVETAEIMAPSDLRTDTDLAAEKPVDSGSSGGCNATGSQPMSALFLLLLVSIFLCFRQRQRQW